MTICASLGEARARNISMAARVAAAFKNIMPPSVKRNLQRYRGKPRRQRHFGGESFIQK